MRFLLLGVAVVVGGLIFVSVWGSFHSRAEPAVELATPAVRAAVQVQATEAARQDAWPCDASQLPDRSWTCIVVQVALQNQGTALRHYDAHQFRLEDQTGYQYPRHLPGYYFPATGSAPLGQGTLLPDARVQGMLWFAAPRRRGPFTLVYQPSQADAVAFRVRLPDPLGEWR